MDEANELAQDVVLVWNPVALEAEIIAAFDVPPEAGERLETAFQRKEHELKQVLARLTVIDARALHRRLVLSLAGDPIASRFSRFIVDRRTRLLDFLASARRREALAAHRAVQVSAGL